MGAGAAGGASAAAGVGATATCDAGGGGAVATGTAAGRVRNHHSPPPMPTATTTPANTGPIQPLLGVTWGAMGGDADWCRVRSAWARTASVCCEDGAMVFIGGIATWRGGACGGAGARKFCAPGEYGVTTVASSSSTGRGGGGGGSGGADRVGLL